MTSFQLATVQLADPVTIYLSAGDIRPRVVPSGPPVPLNAATGEATTFAELECAFVLNVVTQTIHAQLAHIPTPLLIYGPADFAAVAADLPAHHGERVRQCLGSDPAAALQALVNGIQPEAPPRVPREIPNWRAKAILATMGLTAQVEAIIGSLPEPQRTVVTAAWHGDAKLARAGATVTALGQALGMSGADIDALFIAADAIQI